MTPRKKGSDKKTEEPEKTAAEPSPSTPRQEKKKCAFKSNTFPPYRCDRPVWGKHGEEKFCLFHSEKLEEKQEEFKEEIERFKSGETEQFLRTDWMGEEYFDFMGMRFPAGCSDFSGHKFERRVDFRVAAFSGAALFDSAAFSGEAYFSNAVFSSKAFFEVAAFSIAAHFHKATFSGEAVFRRAAFSGKANFSNAVFSSKAFFEVAAFSGEARFFNAAFSGEAWFWEAAFSIAAHFHKATFSGEAVFRGAAFSGKANFQHAAFSGAAVFYKAAFSEVADFTGAAFSGKAVFGHIEGDSRFGFYYAVFEKDVSFDGSRIRSINAENVTYKGKLSFYDFDFTEETKKAPSGNKSDFNGVELERARFVGADLGSVAFGGAFIREVIFDRVSFGRAAECKARWRKRLQKPWLCGRPDEALWEERKARTLPRKPKWRYFAIWFKKSERSLDKRMKAALGENPNLEGIGAWRKGLRLFKVLAINFFPACREYHARQANERERMFRSAETVYRTLKQKMLEQRAGSLARRMRGCELEVRVQGSRNLVEKFFLRVYRFLNGFGLRWFRALVFWVGLVVLFSFFYQGQPAASPLVGLKGLDFFDALRHSLEVSSVIAKPFMTLGNLGMWWVEWIEKILSPALLALFFQAAGHKLRD